MILHVDMDAFYASVEIRDQPNLQGKPVIVGGAPNRRGVVAAASYEARQFGVHSAMPASTAKKLCPHAVFLSPRMEHYAAVSNQIRNVFHRFTPMVEPLSLDEAFLDVSGSESLFGSSIQIGQQIKQEIAEELALVASVGIAPNKFLAKVASDMEKPNGFTVVYPDRIQQFLDPLSVNRLWGVGKVTGKTLKRIGVHTVRDLRGLSKAAILDLLGENGSHLWDLAHGIDDRKVVPDREAKSISHETTFATDIEDIEVLRSWAVELTEHVTRRMRRQKLLGRTVHLKIRYGDFQTITRSKSLQQPTDVTEVVWRAADDMLSTRLPQKHLSIRLLGVGVSGFGNQGDTQMPLFATEQQEEVQSQLDEATDRIRDKFGLSSVGRASRLLHRHQRNATDDQTHPPTEPF